jgi:hypothetical protein
MRRLMLAGTPSSTKGPTDAPMMPPIVNQHETQIANDDSTTRNAFVVRVCAIRMDNMARHPIESNFYASVSDAEIEVTFAPTRSIYIFSRSAKDDGDAISPNPSVYRAGKKGDTGEYAPAEVQIMAHRVALATIKRLHRRQTVLQLWPSQTLPIALGSIG